MDFSADALREQFAKLTKEYDAIDAKRTALQLERDAKHAKTGLTDEARQDYAEKIKKLHAKAAPIEEQRAMISRALGGKTGGE